MNKKLIVFISLVAGIFMLFLRGESMQVKDIDLILSLDKDNFEVGENFTLELKIINNSEGDVRILPWMGPYEYNWFKITNYKDREIEENDKLKFELDPQFPFRDSYILLPPHAFHQITFRGKIEKNKITIEGDKIFSGIFIDFPNSRLLLKSFGKYYVEAKFKNSEFVKNEAIEKYGFDNVWQGEVVSNKLQFCISRSKNSGEFRGNSGDRIPSNGIPGTHHLIH